MNRRKLLAYLLLATSMSTVHAQQLPPWNDPSVNNINRKEPTSDFFAFESISLAEKNDKAASCLLKIIANIIHFILSLIKPKTQLCK